MSLFSHPHKLLREHTQGVVQKVLCWERTFGQKERKLLELIALSHDLGKATRYFQEYLFKKRPQSQVTHHAFLGALFSYYLATQSFDEPFYHLLAYVLPRRHHGNLEDFLYETQIEEKLELLQKQIASIDEKEFGELLDVLGVKEDLLAIDLQKQLQGLRKLRRFIRKTEFSIEEYLFTIYLFSLLIDADKSDVVLQDWSERYCTIESRLIERYIQHLAATSDASINELRYKVFEEVLHYSLEGSIFTLTLPTGLGKTLLSLLFALRHKPKRVIYVLPFLSIIEQNYEAIKKALEYSNIKVNESILLKHHHLSDYHYKGDREFDFDASRLLVTGWDAQIVTTTFMQFFHTIIGYKNSNLRRFHKLQGSFIILDEPQTLPTKYWRLFQNVLEALTKRYGCKVLLTTATKPLIFDRAVEVAKQNYFEKVNRYVVDVHRKPQYLEEFSQNVDVSDRTLFIFNTIQSAKEFYQNLTEPNKLYLSTHIVPKERLRRIQVAQKAKAVVSTQLIEAGVDVDFPVVYRDFAPLDSIIQSAGRCNRHGKYEMGRVHIVWLKNQNDRLYASFIYDPVLLDITQQVLQAKRIQEPQIASLCENYYQEIQKRKSDFASQELLDAMCKLRFQASSNETSISDFVLIKEEPYKEDVFIELDEEAQDVWRQYRKIWLISDPIERKKAFLKIKSRFYEYVVSVPIEDNPPPIVDHFYYVSQESLSEYYDQEYGFIVKKGYFEF